MARVFLIDDHVVVREALATLLESRGHTVAGQCEDIAQAPALLRIARPDVLLLDLQLGLRSGFELVESLQRRGEPVRTIVTTMSEDAHDVARALRAGIEGYLLKSAPTQELLDAIDSVLAGQRHYRGRVAELALGALQLPGAADPLGSLSARERQVIAMVARGQSSAAIGRELFLSPKTVDSYRSRLMAKLGVGDAAGLVRFAVRHGIVGPD
jgi:DNA-binding NarL/FixJ family response regulator